MQQKQEARTSIVTLPLCGWRHTLPQALSVRIPRSFWSPVPDAHILTAGEVCFLSCARQFTCFPGGKIHSWSISCRVDSIFCLVFFVGRFTRVSEGGYRILFSIPLCESAIIGDSDHSFHARLSETSPIPSTRQHRCSSEDTLLRGLLLICEVRIPLLIVNTHDLTYLKLLTCCFTQ